MKRDLTAAKMQFLKDLQTDSDFLRHKKNAQWVDEKFSPYIPEKFYAEARGTFGVANIHNDIRKANLIF